MDGCVGHAWPRREGGGGLTQDTHRYGTDAYLHLNKLGDGEEPLP